jgi:membrane protein
MDKLAVYDQKPSWRALLRLVWNSMQAWFDHGASSMGAAVAFYTIFSLAPLILVLIAIAGFVVGADVAQSAILLEFEELIGTNGTQAVRAIIKGASSSGGGVISLLLGALTIFIGATSVFAELQRNIDLIWEVQADQQKKGLWWFFKIRLLSFALIIGVGFLLIVSLVVSAGISALTTLWGPLFQRWELVLQLLNALVSFGVITVLFALIYKVLPSVRIAWSDVWLGAVFTSFLFSIGKLAIGLYIGKSALSSSYGAAGAFVVLIVWVYYSAQIFFMGTEFTHLYAIRYGSRRSTLPARTTPASTMQSRY